MPKTDADETELLAAFDKGALKAVATKVVMGWLAERCVGRRCSPVISGMIDGLYFPFSLQEHST